MKNEVEVIIRYNRKTKTITHIQPSKYLDKKNASEELSDFVSALMVYVITLCRFIKVRRDNLEETIKVYIDRTYKK